jgi:hypothetical protein
LKNVKTPPKKGGRGGARKGAGKKPGTKWPSTLAKEAAREATRVLITKHLEPIVQSAVANAIGIRYLVVRDKAGKFVRVTEAMARQKLGTGEEVIEVWEKDPNMQALKELLDRALDKAQEPPQALKHEGAIRLRWGSADDEESDDL